MSESLREDEKSESPGQTRTWWHPLLVQLLTFVLEDFCEVRDEINVGEMPLRIDLLLIRMKSRQATARAKRKLRTLLRLLNEYTFVEFKSPTDSLEHGDLLKLVACVLLWGDQQRDRPPRKRISLVLLAPYINQALRDDARFLDLKVRRQSPGLYRLTGLPFTIWLVETDAADPNDPVFTKQDHMVSDAKGSRFVRCRAHAVSPSFGSDQMCWSSGCHDTGRRCRSGSACRAWPTGKRKAQAKSLATACSSSSSNSSR